MVRVCWLRQSTKKCTFTKLLVLPLPRLVPPIFVVHVLKYANQQLTCLDAHTMNVTSVSFHSEGKWLVTGGEDGTIRIW